MPALEVNTRGGTLGDSRECRRLKLILEEGHLVIVGVPALEVNTRGGTLGDSRECRRLKLILEEGHLVIVGSAGA